LAVLSFQRIVSIRDYEDFARAFSGIGKAKAVALWNGEDRLVHITIAAVSGEIVDETTPLYRNLRTAIDKARNPVEAVVVQSFLPLHFNVAATILCDPAYAFENVRDAVEGVLIASFAFGSRG